MTYGGTMTIRDIFAVVILGGLCFLLHPAYGGSIPECGFDVNKVYQARKGGMSKEDLLKHLEDVEDITVERKAFIRKLIDEAYSKSAKDFADDAFPGCGSKI